MMDITEYIHPQLLWISPLLYAVAEGIKATKLTDNKYIPIILGGLGVLLATAWLISTEGVSVDIVSSGIVQGVLCAAAAVYSHQLGKQLGREDDV